jgi:hypothetical protein
VEELCHVVFGIRCRKLFTIFWGTTAMVVEAWDETQNLCHD